MTSQPSIRDKPSSSARQKSHIALYRIMNLLHHFMIPHGYYGIDAPPSSMDGDKIPYKGWKQWVITHTPPNKRVFTSDHKIKGRTTDESKS